MPLIDVNGSSIYYQIVEGPVCQGTLLFIHGSASTHEVWEAHLSNLPAGYHGLALDLPGHGQSKGTFCRSIDEFAGFILEFLNHKNLSRPLFLCGHSMGAAISLYIARYFPNYIDGIILIGGSARMKVYPKVLADLSSGIINPDFIRVTFAPMTDPKLSQETVQEFVQMPAELIYNDLNACDQFDLSNEIAKIQKPTLIIAGKWDRLTPVKHSVNLNLIENSVLKIIEDAGHFMILEKPQEVNTIIATFLRDSST